MSGLPGVQAHRYAAITVAYTVAFAVLLVMLPGDLPQRSLIADVAFLPFHPLAAVLLWMAARTDPARGPRWQGLIALAASQALGTLNTFAWILTHSGFPAYFSYLGVLTTGLSVLGFSRLVPRRATASDAAAVPWLDIALLALAALSVGWYFVGWPMLSSRAEIRADFGWIAAITSADAFCALLALAAWTYPSPRLGRTAAALLACAFGATALAEVLLWTSLVAGTYQGGGWPDIVFAAITAAVAVAAYFETLPPIRERERAARTLLPARALVPLVATVAVFTPVVLGIASNDERSALVVPVAIAAIFVLLLQWRYLLLDREIERTLTARLGLERDLALSRQFESLGRYAGSVAHDFNNLLTVLLPNVDFIRAEPRITPDGHAALDAMDETIRRGATLSKRLLGLTRGHDARPVATDLTALVRSVAESLREVMPTKVRLEVQLPGRSVPVLLRPGDGDQVLLNLIINARDAMPAGGRLSVRLWVESGEAFLEVEDQGTGIPEDVRQRIFEPLFTTKGEGRGTGLGLATVQAVVDQAGGRVSLWSEVGRGTRFTVCVPLAAS